jgi:hypothetical protein
VITKVFFSGVPEGPRLNVDLHPERGPSGTPLKKKQLTKLGWPLTGFATRWTFSAISLDFPLPIRSRLGLRMFWR